MIIPGPVGQDNICLPCTDAPDHVLTNLESGREGAIRMTQNFGFEDPQPARGLSCFVPAHRRQGSRKVDMMTGAPVGNREKFHCVTLGSKARRSAAEPNFTIVGMCADTEETHVAVRSNGGLPQGARSSSEPLPGGVMSGSLPDRTFLFSMA
jgi:hypothetical protein